MFGEYFLFLAEIITVVIAILFVMTSVISLISKNKDKSKHGLTIKKLNKKYHAMADAMHEHIDSKKKYKKYHKQEKKLQKIEENDSIEHKPLLFVIRFTGDLRASAVHELREAVTAVLMIAQPPQDEVLIILESPGGMVPNYGLAASQLKRIRDKKINLTVAVDRVAASGGYLMACVADKIIAAPFAVIGSIGVLLQLPNFNRLLDKHHVDFEMITAGKYKRTLTVFGKNSDAARKKMQDDLEDIHSAFKDFIQTHRPQVDLDAVATGEHWLGNKALDLQLVDAIQTSDDYLLEKYLDYSIFEISKPKRKSLTKKLATQTEESVLNIIDKVCYRQNQIEDAIS